MKRPVLHISFTLVLIFTLGACGGGSKSNGSGSNSSSSSSSSSSSGGSPPETYSVSGSVSNLEGMLSIQLNGTETLELEGSGNEEAFSFINELEEGTSYAVTVISQPDGQRCDVTNGSGTSLTDVSNIELSCSTAFEVSFVISGLAGELDVQLVVEGSLSETMTLTSNGAFDFSNKLYPDETYSVYAVAHPEGEACEFINASGVATVDVTNIEINCSAQVHPTIEVVNATPRPLQGNPMNAAVKWVKGLAINKTIYVFDNFARIVWKFDIENDSDWTQATTFPFSGNPGLIAETNNRLYVEATSTNELWEYDPVGDNWDSLGDDILPNDAAVDWACGGGFCYFLNGEAEMYAFNSTTKQAAKFADLDNCTERSGALVLVDDEKLYWWNDNANTEVYCKLVLDTKISSSHPFPASWNSLVNYLSYKVSPVQLDGEIYMFHFLRRNLLHINPTDDSASAYDYFAPSTMFEFYGKSAVVIDDAAYFLDDEFRLLKMTFE